MTAIESPSLSGTAARSRVVRTHKDPPDTVRAISAATVVVCHAIAILWLPAVGLSNWTHWLSSFAADTAVIVFFVLSGYLISASIGANIARNRRFRVLDYAFSRAVRIYPPLLFAAALSLALFGIMAGAGWPGTASTLGFEGDLYGVRQNVSVTFTDLVDTVLMNNGLLLINGALWSLYVEVKLYIAAGLLAFLVVGVPHLFVRSGIAVVCLWAAWRFGLGISVPQWPYVVWWLMGAVMFGLGQLRLEKVRWSAIALTPFAVAIVILSSSGTGVEVIRVVGVLSLSYGMFFKWTWSEPLTRRMAAYSYTLYLIHFPILIFGYSAFVQFAGPEAPALSWRLVVGVMGVATSFLLARGAATGLEDVNAIKRMLKDGVRASALVRRWCGRCSDAVCGMRPMGYRDGHERRKQPFEQKMDSADMVNVTEPAPQGGAVSLDDKAWRDIVGGLMRYRLWGRMGWQDIKRRYRRTAVGPFWSTLTLGFYVLAVGVVGAGLFKQDPKTYLPYLASGMIVWTMISMILTEACAMFVLGNTLFRNVRFEYSVLAYALVWRNFILMLHNLIVFFLVALVFKREIFDTTLLYIVPGIFLVLLNGVWIALLVGLLCLRFRDIQPLVITVIQVSMLITPIFWTPDSLQGSLRLIFTQLNPIYRMIDIVRAPLLGQTPTLASYLGVLALAVVGWAVTYAIFRFFRKRIPYWS
jgi:ABC-type polysaccharide/polyol phosphate export permease/peptidoglycan/LPS O-acetylase OafA/YrhL